MANRYAGTPLNAEWDAIQRRRAVNQALLEQAMADTGPTQFVRGGRLGPTQAVPYSWGTGAGQIGKALIAGMSDKKARESEAALGEKFDTGRKESVAKLMGILKGKPAGFEGGHPPGRYNEAQPPDRERAMVYGATDPYLQDSDIAKAIIDAQPYGQGRGYRPRTSIYPGETGYVTVPHEGGPAVYSDWPQPGGDQQSRPFTPRLSDVGLAGRQAYSSAYGAGKGRGAADIDPNTGKARIAGDVAQREADVDLDMGPKIAAETEASKIKAGATAEAELAYPQAKGAYIHSLGLVDELIHHPGMKDVIGFPDNPFVLKGKILAGTDAAGFVSRLEQLTGRGFIEIFPSLKGGGPISDTEGAKAQASINRMATAPDEKEFVAAANDFKQELYMLYSMTAGRAGVTPEEPPEETKWPIDDKSERRVVDW